MDTNDIFFQNAEPRQSFSNTSFETKRKTLFDELDSLAKKYEPKVNRNPSEMDVDVDNSLLKRTYKKETKRLRGRESLFKRPEAPLSKCLPVRNVPGFMKNPDKWKRYSLEDVKPEHLSDRGNTAAALSFLKELETRSPTTEDDTQRSDQRTSVLFKKPSHAFAKSAMVKLPVEKLDGKAVFRSSKVVMPEYVVGEKKKPLKKTKSSDTRSSNTSKNIKLDHLSEYNDDD